MMKDIRFIGTDIDSPSLPGSLVNVPGGVSITAGGADIWGGKDQFYFSYREHTGNFDFITRIEALSRADLYSKAGIMARESLKANSSHIYLLVFPDNNPRNNNTGGFELQMRKLEAGDSLAIYPSKPDANPPEFPVNFPNTWMRLKRTGNWFDSFVSMDGRSWKLYASCTLDISTRILLGLAVTSHNINDTATAKFTNISIA